MANKKLTPAEIRAYRDLALAAKRLLDAQRLAEQRRQSTAKREAAHA